MPGWLLGEDTENDKEKDNPDSEKEIANQKGLDLHNKPAHNILPAKKPPRKPKDKLCHLCSFTSYTDSKLNRHIRVVHQKQRDL